MKRFCLGLVAAGVFFLTGSACAFSQTTSELFDRTRNDLQTLVGSKQAQQSVTSVFGLFSSRTNDYAWQNALSSLEQARQYAAAGNEDTALSQISSLQAYTGISEAVRGDLDALSKQLRAEQTAKEAAEAAKVEAACQRAGEAVLKAKEPKDLDATLHDLNQLAEKPASSRYNENRGGRLPNKLQAAVSFVTCWQDYLVALSQRNFNGAAGILRIASADRSNNGNAQVLLVPRSEVLARITQADAQHDAAEHPERTTHTEAQIEAAAIEIMRGTRTLDEVPASLEKVAELRQEFATLPSHTSKRQWDSEIVQECLQELQKTARNLQDGLATSLEVAGSHWDLDGHPEIQEALQSLRVQLIKRAAPRLMGAADAEKPTDGEPLMAYVQRLLEAAKKRQDWDAVVRGLTLKRALASPGTTSSDPEVIAFKNFFAGNNLEQAGQYEQAVISYLTALRSGQEDLPSALIGEHLGAIRKAHPEEYASGEKYVLDPPRPNYDDYVRAHAASTGSGPYDPRFRGPRGAATPSGDAPLMVPAAASTPAPPAATAPPAHDRAPGATP